MNQMEVLLLNSTGKNLFNIVAFFFILLASKTEKIIWKLLLQA